MEVFVARQPIFDIHQKVFAYELLFRVGKETAFSGLDGDEATSEVICRSFFAIGMDAMTGGKRAFINFTGNLLLSEIPLLLPKDIVVVEILENVDPTPEVVEACRRLKKEGYILALDDFVFEPRFKPLLALADIVKVDFTLTKGEERRRVVKMLDNGHLKFLAEKVETREEYNQAVAMGYSYFQGYFFSKPVLLSGKDMASNRIHPLKVLRELNKPEIEFPTIEKLVLQDIAMTYQLLKFINSASFGFRKEIGSVRQALVLLGRKELMKWVSLIALRSVSKGKTDELIVVCMIRARFGELIGQKAGFKGRTEEVFMMGLFSLIDVFVDMAMADILPELPLSSDVKEALLGQDNMFRRIFKLIVAYEQADWENFFDYTKELQLDDGEMPDLYRQAVEWADEVIRL
ncbi:EAL and HDOD domain-containing protein [Azotosporobacter soli]|uniref:EAL and HDOD domain-containing protein n=1 Tax=Azotosporobacter soli TaxID=3055040 RepID=UPI0031FEA179